MKGLIASLGLLLCTPSIWSQDFEKLKSDLDGFLQSEQITGAQVVIRENGHTVFSREMGTIAVQSKEPVTPETLFLIASCSKPFASAITLSLLSESDFQMELDSPISKWLPEYSNPRIRIGKAAKRSPNIGELLGHQAGIYSQRFRMTRAQTRWIRNFDHTLKEAAEGISRSPLIFEPGTDYAYSGAGYCVLGRVCEVATEKDIETLLQEKVCKPLGLEHTTYFPARSFSNDQIATGFNPKSAPHTLGPKHKFALVGGSLYSNASDMALFAEALFKTIHQQSGKPPLPISSGLAAKLTEPASEKQKYGLGWSVQKKDGLHRLSHSGSLQSYRAWIAIDLKTGRSIAACWTLAKTGRNVPVIPLLQKQFK